MLYPDVQPHNSEAAELQKGLTLVIEGKEAAEGRFVSVAPSIQQLIRLGVLLLGLVPENIG
jgi:hypothetical protein